MSSEIMTETNAIPLFETAQTAVAQESRETSEALGATRELISESAQFVASLLTEILPPSPDLKSLETPRAVIIEKYLQALEPEQIVDIEARIEQLAVVADRLHFLVETNAGDSDEAQEIDVFLAQEFEQLLVELKPLLQVMGIEPSTEMAQAFVTYVRSKRYQSKTNILASFIEIEDEGTHEKKLFDEASVFAKAQLTTRDWQQNLRTMIGRLTVYNAAV